MRWDQTEYLLKGIYLGLIAAVALHGPTWREVALLAGATAAGLTASLAWAAVKKMREGVAVGSRALGFFLFLLLENPQAVFTGVILGLTAGTYWIIQGDDRTWLVVGPILGGVVLGFLLWLVRNLPDPKLRRNLSMMLAATLIGGAAVALWQFPLPADQQTIAGALLLLAIPGFYLLMFASFEEETEIDIAALAAALGIGLWLLAGENQMLRSLAIAGPLLVYYTYTRYVLRGLRVFKHALRGLSFRQIGQTDRALASLGRALQLDPNHSLAREQLWELHRDLDLTKIKDDPALLKIIDYPLCVERAASLLLAESPTPAQIDEALHLLELVEAHRPNLVPACWYWRAVAACHRRDFDEAERNLRLLLAAEVPADPVGRRRMLFVGWQLALVLHPEMKRRVGEPLAEQPARRFEAIAAVERELTLRPDDPGAWDLKRVLYAPIDESMYLSVTSEGTPRADFDYAYVRELGLALLEDADRWRRGAELLRIAARGLPPAAATLYTQIAKAHEKFGDTDGMWANYQKAMHIGRAIGVDALAPADRQNFYAVVKAVGERAMAEDRLDAALDAFKFYSQKDDAGIETYRTLAELFERKHDAWTALNCAEHALTYNPADADLLARKDRYYFSIEPKDLKERWDAIHKWFDIDYCRTKAVYVLEKGGGDPALLEWAGHLAGLYVAAKAGSLDAHVVKARVHRARGEGAEAMETLERVRQNKPEKFVSEAEEDAWFLAHRLLGDMYLDSNPAEAVKCFLEFRRSTRAGADTMYKLGLAYERVGDMPRAARCYEEVTTFPDHPLFYEARDGLDRVKRAPAAGS